MKAIKYLFCLSALLMAACSDIDEPIVSTPDGWFIGYDEAQATITRYGRHHTLSLTLPEGETVLASSEASWLHLATDTLSADGYLDFYADANTGAARRTADILFTSVANTEKQFAITITQCSEADEADNAVEDLYHVGSGFNAYAEYQSENSLKNAVIDIELLEAWAADDLFQPIQTEHRAEMSFEVFTAQSLRQMSSKLSKTTQSNANVLFYRKTVERIKNICTKTIDEQAMGYARLQKIVATRSIDEGALKYIIDKSNTRATEGLPFTDGFQNIYNGIINNPSQRDKLIDTMIDTYGTHLVTRASMGCSIDYAVTFSCHTNQSSTEDIERQCKQVFGKNTNENHTNYSQSVTSSVNSSTTFQIAGGTAATQDALRNAIYNIRTADDVLPTDKLQAWQASITPADADSTEGRKNLAVLDFHFIPIWQLFPESLRAAIQEQVIKKGEQSNNKSIFTDNELGTDNYEISLPYMRQKFGIDNFSTAASATQARIIYQGKTPVVEVCHEYVPKIRGDRRITVYYPIRQGVAQIGMGIFPGDGEGNAPAYLIFSEGDCYVNPIDGYGSSDRIEILYYLHGRLYTEMYDTYVLPTAQCGYQVQDEYLNYYHTTGQKISYPMVKIGSGYWLRCNMKDKMGFGTPTNPSNPNSTYRAEEIVTDGMLYTHTYKGQAVRTLNDNKSVYGRDTDDVTGEATLWYLPMKNDVDHLFTYLGRNAKAMFAGQPSGFEAQFAGYRGNYDVFTGANLGVTPAIYGKGEYCCIVSKDVDNNDYVHVFANDYTIPAINPHSYVNNNWYTVRLFRTARYKHPDLK